MIKKTTLIIALCLSALLAMGQSQNLYESQALHVKFKRDFVEKKLQGKRWESPNKKTVLTQIPAIDKLQKKFGVYHLAPLFAVNPHFEQRYKAMDLDLFYEVRSGKEIDLEEMIASYAELDMVEIAEKIPLMQQNNGIKKALTTDKQVSMQWGLKNENYMGFDIQVENAWKISKGDPRVIVAIIDNCVDINHPDLVPNLWINTLEIPDNGVDDDNNGFVDDIYGWNFVDNNPYVLHKTATEDHGTHVAGIVAARSNNLIGVAGVAGGWGEEPGVRLMTFRTGYIGEDGKSYISHGYNAMLYAADHGAAIAQCSWGGGGSSAASDSVLRYFKAYGGGEAMTGGLVIAAAGNENSSIQHYPAAARDVLSVGSIQKNGARSSFSNYGTWVKICAPGSEIMSCIPEERYGNMNGTSMACPMVSGVAALVLSAAIDMPKADKTTRWLTQILTSTANTIDLDQEMGKLVNASAAVLSVQVSSNQDLQEAQSTFAFSPNPVSSLLNIKGDFNKIIQTELFLLNGQRVLCDRSGKPSLNLENIPIGQYIIRVETDKGTLSHKIIKK